MQGFHFQHQEDPTFCLHGGYSGVCSVTCHLKLGLLHLAPGGSSLKAIQPFQLIHNAVPRFVFHLPKFSYINPFPSSLYCLLVDVHIRFNTRACLESQNRPSFTYSKALITLHSAPCSLQAFGGRAFVAGGGINFLRLSKQLSH